MAVDAIHILIIEDTPEYVRLVREFLNEFKGIEYQLKAKKTLHEALDALTSDIFDVVLLDLGLPDSQSFDTFEKVVSAAKKVPILVISNNEDSEVAKECLRRGAQGYLIKGQAEPTLSSIIKNTVDRNRLFNEISVSNTNLENLINGAQDGILILDSDGNICLANPAAQTMFSSSESDIVGKPFGTPIEAETEVEIEIPRISGGVLTAEMRSSSLVWDGELSQVIILRDITENKRNRERVTHLNRVLYSLRAVNRLISREKDQETLIRQICTLLVQYRSYDGAALILTDEFDQPFNYAHAGTLVSFNQWIEGMRVGQLPSCFDKAKGSTEAIRIIEQDYTIAATDSIEQSGGFCIQLKHNENWYGYLIVIVSQRVGSEEERALFTEMAGDISFALCNIEQAMAYEKAQQEKSRIEAQLLQSQKMEAIGRLAGGVAHDFNNLLMVIMGYSDQLLAGGIEKNSPEYPMVENILDAGERAKDLTMQLLAFGRQQVYDIRVVDLNQIITNFKNMLERLIREDIKISFQLSPDLRKIKADLTQVEQVLLNLAINARDAMPHGGQLTIETENVTLDQNYASMNYDVKPGSYAMLAVSDTGCGMSNEIQKKVFDPFFTTKEAGKGSGLGLSTVFGIVKQHEGHISVYSEVKEGTTFKVYFPCMEADEVESSVEKQNVIDQDAVEHGSETILVVEDDAAVLSLVHRFLLNFGYNTIKAPDAETALRAARLEKIDLLLTDVIMPNKSGRQLYEEIAVLHPKLKVVFMSGYTDRVITQHETLEEGFHFLQKPFTMQKLGAKIREAIGR